MTDAQLEAEYIKASEAYLRRVIRAMCKRGPIEFDFIKAVTKMDTGSTYLVQIQHVGGPKLILEPGKKRNRR